MQKNHLNYYFCRQFNHFIISRKDILFMTSSKKFRIVIIGMWSFILIPIITFSVWFYLISVGKLGFMPDFKRLENPKISIASEIISSDHQLLGSYYEENRTIVEFDDLCPNLINSLVAIEDVRFYEHSGIDGQAFFRVIYGVLTGSSKGGGSTLSQQLAKNLFPRENFEGKGLFSKLFFWANVKFREWVTAVKLERNYTKEEIMVMYLNTIPFGSQAVGIKAAAKTFFNTTPDSLKIEEAALLVGIVKGPTQYSPIPPRNDKDTIRIRRQAKAFQRRNVVMKQMAKYHFITEEKYDSLRKLPIKIDYNPQAHDEGLSTYFREFLRIMISAQKPDKNNYPSWQSDKYSEDSLEWETNSLYGWCNKNFKPDSTNYNIYSDGLKIFTTIDSRMQRYAEESVKEHMSKDLQPAFYREKKGKAKGPFARDLTVKQIRDILESAVRRSERYRVLSQSGFSWDSIKANFNRPVPMTIFTWDGEKDTIMSPMDSVRYYKYLLNAGLMSMDPITGQVKAYVGGIDFKYFKYDHVTASKRQVGSTFKPFLYTLAMMPGEFSPCYKVPNIEVSFKMPEGQEPAIYTPEYSTSKYLKKYDGKMITLKFALANSLNQISAWIMKQYSPDAVIQIARKMGIKTFLDPVYALCVGAAEVKLCEMVGAYSTFANKGVFTEPIYVTRIEDRNGNVIAKFSPKRNEAISEETAYKMINLMEGVVNGGTSTRLRYTYKLTNEIAGKTGTTNNHSDGWFIGLVPQLVTGAWVGGEERSIHFDVMDFGQGAHMALPMWGLYMQKVYADKSLNILPSASFERPPTITDDQLKCDNNLDPEKTEEYNDIENSDDEKLF
jgi:penicillin-binding protein 1A